MDQANEMESLLLLRDFVLSPFRDSSWSEPTSADRVLNRQETCKGDYIMRPYRFGIFCLAALLLVQWSGLAQCPGRGFERGYQSALRAYAPASG